MLTSHELLGFMSPALAKDILQFTFESDKPAYKATVASKGGRPSMCGLSFLNAASPARPGMSPCFSHPRLKPTLDVAADAPPPRLAGKKNTRPCSWIFWNAPPDIPNEEGVVEDLPASVDDIKLKAAVELLVGKYPHEVVAVYLNAFNDMNTANWPNLASRWLEGDSGWLPAANRQRV